MITSANVAQEDVIVRNVMRQSLRVFVLRNFGDRRSDDFMQASSSMQSSSSPPPLPSPTLPFSCGTPSSSSSLFSSSSSSLFQRCIPPCCRMPLFINTTSSNEKGDQVAIRDCRVCVRLTERHPWSVPFTLSRHRHILLSLYSGKCYTLNWSWISFRFTTSFLSGSLCLRLCPSFMLFTSR